MADLRWLEIEVVYANPQQQCLIALCVATGTNLRQAVAYSQIAAQFPEHDFAQFSLGIFSKLVSANTQVQAGDRVEIYHPLLFDPKTARRARVQQQREQSATVK